MFLKEKIVGNIKNCNIGFWQCSYISTKYAHNILRLNQNWECYSMSKIEKSQYLNYIFQLNCTRYDNALIQSANENQKFIFSTIICQIRKKRMNAKLFASTRCTNFVMQFLMKFIFFVSIPKKRLKFMNSIFKENMWDKNNFKVENYLPEWELQIFIWNFFDRIYISCCNFRKHYWKITSICLQKYVEYEKSVKKASKCLQYVKSSFAYIMRFHFQGIWNKIK